jgi:hypothetical protein
MRYRVSRTYMPTQTYESTLVREMDVQIVEAPNPVAAATAFLDACKLIGEVHQLSDDRAQAICHSGTSTYLINVRRAD